MSYIAPSYPRWDYGNDGTRVLSVNTSLTSATDITSSFAGAANDEDDDYYNLGFVYGTSAQGYLVFLFPETRTLEAYFLKGYTSRTTADYYLGGNLQYSTDTTNGLDGNWATIEPVSNNTGAMPATAITGINSVTPTAVKAVRYVWGQNYSSAQQLTVGIQVWHMYGTYQHQGLVFWHPTMDKELYPVDLSFGDVVQGATQSLKFRVKNNHASLTASTINVSSVDVSTNMSCNFSVDGTNFSSAAVISSLAPGAISAPITLRRVVSGSNTVQLQTSRVSATATSWA